MDTAAFLLLGFLAGAYACCLPNLPSEFLLVKQVFYPHVYILPKDPLKVSRGFSYKAAFVKLSWQADVLNYQVLK